MEDNGEKLELIKSLENLKGEFSEFKDTIKDEIKISNQYNREEHRMFNEKVDRLLDGCKPALEAQEGVKKAHGRIDTVYRLFFTTMISISLIVIGWFVARK